ncbi:MAG: phosphopantetheine-binding protein [Planctomycetota bacterium]
MTTPTPAPATEAIAEALTQYINDDIMAAGHEITKDALFADAGVDSMALMKVLLFVEQEYGFWIPDEDLTEDVVASAETMAVYIQNKMAG